MTLGMLASQFKSREIAPDTSADKWKLFRALCEAKPRFGISERALSVLNALLSFYPDGMLSEENGLVVFPSNAQLSLRAHGMAEATLRRHIAALVDAGLIIRNDSPNGKRYARKDGNGAIDKAFGFSLAPLLSRSVEIFQLAAEVQAERLHLRRLRERLTLCSRDIGKLIEVALEEGTSGNWDAIQLHQRSLTAGAPRSATSETVATVLDEMEMLREEVVNLLEAHMKKSNTSGNADHTERHIQNSNTDSITELEPSSRKEQGEKPSETSKRVKEPIKAFPLGMVLAACPEISMYGPGGTIASWRDLMSAAVVVRSMLGVSPSAYEKACEVLGPENASAAMACILERGGQINSAGGYLRDLTRRAERGEFSMGPMIMALMRANASVGKRAG